MKTFLPTIKSNKVIGQFINVFAFLFKALPCRKKVYRQIEASDSQNYMFIEKRIPAVEFKVILMRLEIQEREEKLVYIAQK